MRKLTLILLLILKVFWKNHVHQTEHFCWHGAGLDHLIHAQARDLHVHHCTLHLTATHLATLLTSSKTIGNGTTQHATYDSYYDLNFLRCIDADVKWQCWCISGLSSKHGLKDVFLLNIALPCLGPSSWLRIEYRRHRHQGIPSRHVMWTLNNHQQ